MANLIKIEKVKKKKKSSKSLENIWLFKKFGKKKS